MDLYVKKEQEDGNVTFEKLEAPPSEAIRNLMADYRYMVSQGIATEALGPLLAARTAVLTARF